MNTTANNSIGSVGWWSPPMTIILNGEVSWQGLLYWPQIKIGFQKPNVVRPCITEINYMISNVPTRLVRTKPNMCWFLNDNYCILNMLRCLKVMHFLSFRAVSQKLCKTKCHWKSRGNKECVMLGKKESQRLFNCNSIVPSPKRLLLSFQHPLNKHRGCWS